MVSDFAAYAVSELAENLAEELGVKIAKNEAVGAATAFVCFHALREGIELVLPAVASGMSFSMTGIHLPTVEYYFLSRKLIFFRHHAGIYTAADQRAAQEAGRADRIG